MLQEKWLQAKLPSSSTKTAGLNASHIHIIVMIIIIRIHVSFQRHTPYCRLSQLFSSIGRCNKCENRTAALPNLFFQLFLRAAAAL